MIVRQSSETSNYCVNVDAGPGYTSGGVRRRRRCRRHLFQDIHVLRAASMARSILFVQGAAAQPSRLSDRLPVGTR